MNVGPRLLLTMGDVAGIGPEVIARGWPQLVPLGSPVVVGSPPWLRRALRLVNSPADVQLIARPEEARPAPGVVPCLPGTDQDLGAVEPGRVSAAAGRAAYDFL